MVALSPAEQRARTAGRQDACALGPSGVGQPRTRRRFGGPCCIGPALPIRSIRGPASPPLVASRAGRTAVEACRASTDMGVFQGICRDPGRDWRAVFPRKKCKYLFGGPICFPVVPRQVVAAPGIFSAEKPSGRSMARPDFSAEKPSICDEGMACRDVLPHGLL